MLSNRPRAKCHILKRDKGNFPSRLSGAWLLLFGVLLHFSANAQYVLNGNAVTLGPESFRLTTAETYKSGSAWYQNKLNLNSDFQIKANLNLGNRSASNAGADGIAFVLQPICSGLGAVGGGIGYKDINPSLAVEFDTWQNPGNNDPAADHIALQKNGDTDHGSANKLAGPFTLPELENGLNHPVIITWTKATNNLKVTLDGTVRINYSGDIIREIFRGDPQVFWGFTAATGAAYNVQTVAITSKIFRKETPYALTLPSCPNTNDGAINLTATGNQGPFTFKWSNGSTQEDLVNVPSNVYTVTVTDRNNCKSRYTIDITVKDKQAPSISCPSNIILGNDNQACGAVVSFAAKASDDCTANPALSYAPASGSTFPVGVTTVTSTAKDESGNTASCKFTVTVKDKEAPKISCPADIAVKNDPGVCGAKVDFEAKASDNCTSDVFIGYSASPGGLFPEGITAVTCTGTDDFGNSAKCSFSITVKDSEAPQISCPPHLTLSCESSQKPNVTGDPTATDNCAVDKFDFDDSKTTSTCPGNFKINRTWTVLDVHGNSSSCLQAITFEDNTPPTLNCPPNVTVTCDVGPNSETGKANAVDNCDPAPGMKHSDKVLDGDCAWLCTIERIWVTTDNCGNSQKCAQIITRNTLPLLEQALRQDVDGDGVTDTLVLGASQNTLTLAPGTGNCIQKWLPSKGTVPVGLEQGKIQVDGNCRPGLNKVDENGKLTDPLVAEALKLNILVRLDPKLGTTIVKTLNCNIAPIVLQNLGKRDDSDVNELLRVTDTAIGKIALQPHLKELLEALQCINGSLEACK